MNKKQQQQLESLSKSWTREPVAQDEWQRAEAERVQLKPEQLEAAFRGEWSEEHPLWEPLEVPDQMRITHRYSLGGQSPFFRALRDYKKILGTRCDECDFVYCPPRTHCSRCYGETNWVELSGKGTVESYTIVHTGHSLSGRTPYVCAYIRLEGSNFVILSNIEMEDAHRAHTGMPVRIEFKDNRVGRVTDFYFVPEEL